MSLQLKEVLKNLCCNNGWSYGVFWRVNHRNSMLLTFDDAYFEEQMGIIISNMLHDVHMLGEGIIGQVVFTGKHRWITSDTYCGEWNTTGFVNNQYAFKDNSEFLRQFSSGIKTIALISVAPQGVVQFGSTEKIFEILDFVDHVRSLFQHLESVSGLLLGNAQIALNPELYDPQRSKSSIFCSTSSCSYYGNNRPMHDDFGKEMMAKTQSSMVIPQPYPMNSGYQHCSTAPLTSYSHLKNQLQTAGAEAQVILATPNMKMPQVLSQFTSSSADNSSSKTPITATGCNEGSTLTTFEQQILYGMEMQQLPNLCTETRQAPMACRNTRQNFQGRKSSTSSGTSEPNMVVETVQAELNKHMVSTTFQATSGVSKPPIDTAALSKPDAADSLSHLVPKSVDQGDAGLISTVDRDLSNTLGLASMSSGLIRDEVFSGIPIHHAVNPVQDTVSDSINPLHAFCDGDGKSSNLPVQLPADNDLFSSFGLDFGPSQGKESWDDIMLPSGSGSRSSLSAGASECVSELDVGSMSSNQKGFFTDFGLEQLLEGVFSNAISDTRPTSEDQLSSGTIGRECSLSEYSNQVQFAGISCLGGTMPEALPECKLESTIYRSPKESVSKSRVSSWIDDSYSINSASASVTNPKRSEEPPKGSKRRARPGESTRPRPKDRQQIQDRVKELREIVPSGAKCSIDALLDRTIKHMLFLQSVAKYADKLKQLDEPKMIGKENGVVLKDNSNGSSATWAFEVGCPTMVCPIVVENLSPPGQMLVEMLCDERGFFLEIADIIRGFGLTILKGVMEARENKICARFIVEANRNNITRMDIFLSLVQLLQETTTAGMNQNNQPTKGADGGVPACTDYQAPMPLPVEMADQLR